MHFRNLLYISYWFSQPQTAQGAVLSAFLVIFIGATLAGIALLIARSYYQEKSLKHIFGRAGLNCLTVGLLGLFWLWLRQERAAFFSWRFWAGLVAILGLVWAIKIIHYLVRRYPQIKIENKERALKQKYLPSER